jgi:hypothetical protein
MGEFMSTEHWWNETYSAHLKYADRNCPTAATPTTNPVNGSRSASEQADNRLPEPRHCLAGRYESPSSCILFDSPQLSAILSSLLICDATLLPKFNVYFPQHCFLDCILNVITVNLLYALQYSWFGQTTVETHYYKTVFYICKSFKSVHARYGSAQWTTILVRWFLYSQNYKSVHIA